MSLHQNPNVMWSPEGKPVLAATPEESVVVLASMVRNFPTVHGSFLDNNAVIAGADLRFHADIDEVLISAGRYTIEDLDKEFPARFQVYHMDREGTELDINIFARNGNVLELCHRALHKAIWNLDFTKETLRAFLTDPQAEYKGSFHAFNSTGLAAGAAMELQGRLFEADDHSIVYDHKTGRLASGNGHDHAAWKLGSMNSHSMSVRAACYTCSDKYYLYGSSRVSKSALVGFANKLIHAGLPHDKKVVLVGRDDEELTLEQLRSIR